MSRPIPPLLPDDTEIPRRVFANEVQLARFQHSFQESIKPKLEELKKARQDSEEEAKSRWLR